MPQDDTIRDIREDIREMRRGVNDLTSWASAHEELDRGRHQQLVDGLAHLQKDNEQLVATIEKTTANALAMATRAELRADTAAGAAEVATNNAATAATHAAAANVSAEEAREIAKATKQSIEELRLLIVARPQVGWLASLDGTTIAKVFTAGVFLLATMITVATGGELARLKELATRLYPSAGAFATPSAPSAPSAPSVPSEPFAPSSAAPSAPSEPPTTPALPSPAALGPALEP